ncbi:MAG: class I SAM-dependent methyltransferase [Bryobacteraceae bacterium]
MPNRIAILEMATSENLFPRGYLLANYDLRKKFKNDEAAAIAHFNMRGHKEARRQVTRRFIERSSDPEIKSKRFERFRDCLVSIPDGAREFPLQFGKRVESLTDYDCESANASPGNFLDELDAHPDNRYADIGAGLRDVVCENCLCVEVYPSLTTDVVIEPTCELPFKDASLDGVGCFAVLEHVRTPWKMAAEFARVTKPGGRIFVDWPFLQPVHGFPSHYFNATREGLQALFARYFIIDQVSTGAHQGPDYTVTWILSWLLERIKNPEIRAMVEARSVAELAREPPQSDFWRKVIGSLRDDDISTLSCGNNLVGVRNGDPFDQAPGEIDIVDDPIPRPWWKTLFQRFCPS